MSDDLAELVRQEAMDGMTKAVAHARQEFSTVRTGRATPDLVKKLPVDYHGTDVELQQLAGFSVPEARLLVISPFDKGSVPAIEKAIQNSDLGLNPSSDGQVVRLAFPQLTEERRKELVRVVRQMAEQGRVSIRNQRRTSRHDLEALEKDGDLSKDELERAEKQLDELKDQAESDIERALEHKEQELLEV